jgi:hypothetical protein
VLLARPPRCQDCNLPKIVLALLKNPQAHKHDPTVGHTNTTLLVADTGATDHMLPGKAAFISYVCVRQGDNMAPVLFLFLMTAFAETLEIVWREKEIPILSVMMASDDNLIN